MNSIFSPAAAVIRIKFALCVLAMGLMLWLGPAPDPPPAAPAPGAVENVASRPNSGVPSVLEG